MIRTISITVEPSSEHPEILDVRDAMQQVLDFFDLMTDQNDRNVVWNLTFASTNSPFKAEGAPVDLRTNAGAFAAVSAHVEKIERGMSRIIAGEDLEADFPREKREVVARILKRNLNGIGATKINFGAGRAQLKIVEETAARSLEIVESRGDALHSYLFSSFARREVGSVEGRIVDLGTDYDEPGLRIREQKSGREFWCRIDAITREELESKLTAGDVWAHRRIRVRGTLNYNHDGKLTRVFDGKITYISPPEVTLEQLRDPEFTEGYSAAEYLERLRENDFG